MRYVVMRLLFLLLMVQPYAFSMFGYAKGSSFSLVDMDVSSDDETAEECCSDSKRKVQEIASGGFGQKRVRFQACSLKSDAHDDADQEGAGIYFSRVFQVLHDRITTEQQRKDATLGQRLSLVKLYIERMLKKAALVNEEYWCSRFLQLKHEIEFLT